MSSNVLDFQMTFAPKAWQDERASWRAVIQLNLVRAVNTILDALIAEMAATRPPSRATGITGGAPSSPPVVMNNILGDVDEDDDDEKTTDSHKQGSSDSHSRSAHSALPLTSQHSMFKLSLSPLRSVETDLKMSLGSGTEEINADSNQFSMATPFDSDPGLYSPATSLIAPKPRRPQEFTVRSMHSWKSAVGNRSKPSSPRAQTSELESLTEVISGCRDDIQALWQDALVTELVRRKQIKLQDSAV